MKQRIRLPVDSDLCHASFRWAVECLGEQPRLLRVSPEEDVDVADMATQIDHSLARFAWVVEGDTREVYSDGG